MEDKKVLDRFSALLGLVSKVHDQCKRDHDVMTLIDIFAEHNSLSLAFREDCETYLPNKIMSVQLSMVLNEIYSALCCSVEHLQRSAQRLQTPIIDHFIKQIVGPRPPPN